MCFPTKKELAGETIRKEVCPSLRPAQIAKLLENYRADVFDSAPVPSELVAQLLAQDKAYKVTDATFEADVCSLELTFVFFSYIYFRKLRLCHLSSL